MDFPETDVGNICAPQSVTFTNTFAVSRTITAVLSNDSAFKVTGGSCVSGTSLATGASCNALLTFSPQRVAAFSAKLNITTAGNSIPAVVNLTGTGTVTLLAAGTSPTITAADCPRLQSQPLAVGSLVLASADMQQVAAIVQNTSPSHGYQLFVRMPQQFMWWVRSQGGRLDMGTLGAALHETNHQFNAAMSNVCNTDRKARLLLDSVLYSTDLVNGNGSTQNYSIAGQAVPPELKTGLRYDAYISSSATVSGNDFSVMLDELNAYTGGTAFEIGLLTSTPYSSLKLSGNFNAGGMVDFMMYTLAYLKTARLNYPSTYTTLQGQPHTLEYLQAVWFKAEANLAALYPHTALAGTGGMVVSKETLAATYAPALISELDLLGIPHQPLSAWDSTYLH